MGRTRERYAPLIWSICGRYGPGHAAAIEVGQSVWRRLASQPDKIGDPAALPGWLAATTRRECDRVLRTAHGPHARDAENLPNQQANVADQELRAAERHAALLEAFSHLPQNGQQLIAMLIADPPVADAEISTRLGIPVDSIGPDRSRYLDKLRRDPALATLTIGTEAANGQQQIQGSGRSGNET